jgi:hypothetical protein
MIHQSVCFMFSLFILRRLVRREVSATISQLALVNHSLRPITQRVNQAKPAKPAKAKPQAKDAPDLRGNHGTFHK